MTTNIQRIEGTSRRAQSTIAAALMKGYLEMGVDVLYVAPVYSMASDFAKRLNVPDAHCGTMHELISGRAPSVVILADVNKLDMREGHPVEIARKRMLTHTHPTEIFLID